MKTIKDVFADFHRSLHELYGAQEAEAIALIVITEISNLTRAKVKAFPENILPPEALEKLPVILEELKTGKPLQYILGITEFYGLPFLVNPAVLIPRPETEEMVQWALSVCNGRLAADSGPSAVADGKASGGSRLRILDIGTGSGCIAISLKKNLPDADVTAIDISESALDTARQNAMTNGVDVNFVRADILNTMSEIEISKFDMIISNPPYVTLQDKALMHTNVIDFEPHSALFVPENDALVFYSAIADFAINKLENAGLLFFEINEAFGKQIVQLLSGKGFKNIELRKDMSGRDRMIRADR